jgi:hypothetical protein
MAKSGWIAAAVVLYLFVVPPAGGVDNISVETVLTGLKSPCGVAIRPSESAERYEVFVVERGAGRIVRVASDAAKSTAADVITGFSPAELGDDGLPAGPVGLLFLDRRRLVIGIRSADSASVRLYELPDDAVSLQSDAAQQEVIAKSDRETPNHVYAIGRTHANETVRDALVLTHFDNGQSGDLRTITLRADTLAESAPFVESIDSANGSPAAIAVGDGGYVVVGWLGGLEKPRDSRLVFYNPANGRQLMERTTDLYDILGLAYSPRTGNLYAADAAWMDVQSGGVFRIDAAKDRRTDKCDVVKIADIIRPSALTFGPDGALYVTAFGELQDESASGILVKISGDL